MAQIKLTAENAETLRENEKKWSKEVMAAGWSAVPSILIEKQEALGLQPIEMNVMLHLFQYWWFKDNLPHPSVGTMAKSLGVTDRTIQRTIKRLSELGFMEKEERRHTRYGSATNLYSFNGLIEKLKPHAAEKVAARKQKIDAEKERIARKKPKLVVVNK
jgi:predicted transcriptional regulator